MKRRISDDSDQQNKKINTVNFDKFVKLGNELTKTNSRIEKNEKKMNILKKKLKVDFQEFLNNVNKLAMNVEKGIPNVMKGFHRSFLGMYTKNFKNSFVPEVERSVSKLEESTKKLKRESKKLENLIESKKKKMKFQQCNICCEMFKPFKRNCLCKSEQYMCINCIKHWYDEKIGKGKIQHGHIPCPYCKGEMLRFKCPYCVSNNKNNNCDWCKINRNIKDMKNNFIENKL